MGRRAESNEAKAAKGVQPCRMNDEPAPPVAPLGDPPTWFSPLMQSVWRHIVAELDSLGRSDRADGHALALYCQAYATWWEASAVVEDEGLMVDGFAGTKKAHPLLTTVRQTRGQMIEILKQFGLTPQARGAILAEKPKEVDPLVEFMKSRGKPDRPR